MSLQYNVVIIGKGSDPWKPVASVAQRILPYDQSGNPDGWTFSREEIDYVGRCVVLKTSDLETSERVFSELKNIQEVNVFDPTISDLEKVA